MEQTFPYVIFLSSVGVDHASFYDQLISQKSFADAFNLFLRSMTVSDMIEVISIIASLITSIIAIAISLKTLRQNSRMIEESSRPYIGIYGTSVHIQQPQYYIIIKNFGQSGALITSFRPSIDMQQISKDDGFIPFSHFEGVSIMPGQSFRSAIDFKKVSSLNLSYITFDITYSCGKRTYSDSIQLKVDANLGNVEAHQVPKATDLGKNVSVLSETLQDMHIKHL